MVKAITTIYINSDILGLAKSKKLEISSICEEALRISLNANDNSGSVEGAFGNFLNQQAQKKKDIETIRKLKVKNSSNFNAALRAFCIKYDLQLHEGLKVCGL